MLAKASCPPTHSALAHRVRQQAGSYRGSAVPFHVLIAATPSIAERITTRSVRTIKYRRVHSNDADLWDRLQPGKRQQPRRKGWCLEWPFPG